MARTNVITKDGAVTGVEVVLSRRNILALLHKLDMPGSARTIVNNDSYLDEESDPHLILLLRCEDDEPHYQRRIDRYGEASAAGVMHPDTEAFIQGSDG